MKTTYRIAAGLGLALLAAAPALAHPGHGAATFAAGLSHPFSGWDHILAMTAVGLWAARRGGWALVGWPTGFVAAMLAGYGLGAVYPGLPLVEPAILASVIVLGAAVAASIETPFAAGLALVGLFGLCHGYAHGVEAAPNAGLGFPIGFAISTAALHLAGLTAGLLAMRLRGPLLLRLAGGGVMVGGLALALAG
jgi:urease accessory protein